MLIIKRYPHIALPIFFFSGAKKLPDIHLSLCSTYKNHQRSFAIISPNKTQKIMVFKPHYHFTSSSNPNQVPLIEEVQAKVLQVLKVYKPRLFEDGLPDRKPTLIIKDQNFKRIDKDIHFQKLGIDSLDQTQIVVAMQEMFGVELSDQQARNIKNVGMAIDIFFTKINAQITNKIVERDDRYGSVRKK